MVPAEACARGGQQKDGLKSECMNSKLMNQENPSDACHTRDHERSQQLKLQSEVRDFHIKQQIL